MRFLFLGCFFGIISLTSPGRALDMDARKACHFHAEAQERQWRIPQYLLRAISQTETGRHDSPWPWSLNVQGKSKYYASKKEALVALKSYYVQGVRNIDVGCMQINLKFHPKAFNSLEKALDPAVNVAYGAQYLAGLREKHRSWSKAVAYYHSSNPLHHVKYRGRVMKTWMLEKNKAVKKRRKERLLRNKGLIMVSKKEPRNLQRYLAPYRFKAWQQGLKTHKVRFERPKKFQE